ncbi:ribonuclease E/G [Methylosinus sp. Ce-a6]|uniref:Rne/Rng family ribonuclease n=1 Tax=Methylosinus sp. Ce-a6 TaxID=2172005 RepID=UPI0013599EFD|nr:ribonuclease E/G [Methylosinus sp. Ce-a6]
MANKMLIDASHPEETRVVVLRGNRVQEFDFEAADKKPLRGNIYLAKVTRVEPSLQAAFVDYGGNRHGFLAFAEIHPDYYQIPVADRLALLEEESRVHQQEEEEPRPHGRRRSRRRHSDGAEKRAHADEVISESAGEGEELSEGEAVSAAPAEENAVVERETSAQEAPAEAAPVAEAASDAEAPPAAEVESAAVEAVAEPITVDPQGYGVVEAGHPEEAPAEPVEPDHEVKARRQDERDEEHEAEREEARRGGDDEDHDEEEEHEEEEEHVEHIGGDAMEEVPHRPSRSRRQYKIQEVIKRRQVLLVQVVKEERGNKGAALTTYLSLAGRYSVLMPNTARGGGISRKITDGADRKRLKEIVQELEVPEGMGVILRTAGATRTKAEVKRDFEYLLRMWESVRELTLRSSAPTLVYEEGSLIKRAIRDLYGRDVDEVVVSGDDAYREAKDFMRMLIPSHAKNVRLFRDPNPIFASAGAEAQLDALFSNQVTLKSGGYLVINQTEALVAIDVNSGRSTREHNIEDTALRTNLEAADEVARQLRLRDLAGLIVVDFIDMEEGRNNRAVERRLKDALKNDRARIQVGRISHFGLLEMSRQRIRAGVLEGSTVPCPHCAGAGTVRSTASIALHVLRVLEDALIKSAAHDIILRTRTVVALYILNQKRGHLQALERRFGVAITVSADDTLTGANYHALERGEPATGVREIPVQQPLRVDSLAADLEEEEPEEAEAAGDEGEIIERRGEARREDRGARAPVSEEEGDGQPRSRRRRRRRGRGGGLAGGEAPAPGAEQPSDEGLAMMAEIDGVPTAPANEIPRPAERGSRGGRGRRAGRWTRSSPLPPEFREQGSFPLDEGVEETAVSAAEAHVPPFEPGEALLPVVGEQAAPAAPPPVEAAAPSVSEPEPQAPQPEAFAPAAAARAPEPTPAPIAHEAAAPPPPREPTETIITEADPNRPKKGGWWQRAKASIGTQQ